MKKTLTFCDLCGKEDKEEYKHWTQSWGTINLNFKNMSRIQQEYDYRDCCPDCANILHDAFKEAKNKIIAENKSPLAEALK